MGRGSVCAEREKKRGDESEAEGHVRFIINKRGPAQGADSG